MQTIPALVVTENVNYWLVNSRQPRILHVFDRACNLINERCDVLSVVTAEIGNGPLNLVVEKSMFLDNLSIESRVFMHEKNLNLGDLTITTATAKTWDPCPNWESLHEQQNHVLHQLQQLQNANYKFSFQLPFSNSLITNFASALANADTATAINLASHFVGLGIGLTPSGDDFLMGAMYAAWILHPREVAVVLAREIANAAAPFTTSLSAALLKSAARGEAGILWHEFFDALNSGSPVKIQDGVEKLLAVGASSGGDALAGFTNTFRAVAGGI
jgi:Protein of unknown function (DUF2877)